ncbi:XAC2610-related protein [Cardiobacterium hominis]|uniref:FG-GAP repeat protein n=1 Tax=Cardiobacterium hominis TaxID=2718 RepID=A0A1C3NEL8_9GAMM|nr:hypothetical protein [Cardiobacterium hominis]SBV31025.1 hypothetical protein CHUV0807_0828 [Cardiobacterium hominis]
MQTRLLTVALLTCALTAHAQTYPLPNLPQGWTGSAEIAQCTNGTCAGAGKIQLNTGKHAATFPVEFPEFDAPTTQGAALPYSPVEIDDFNFDGKDDIAVLRGHHGPYGSDTYDIYLQTTTGNWAKSRAITELTDNYMGLPETDAKRKLLIVHGKSGAAIHYTAHYRPTAYGVRLMYSRTDTNDGCGKNKDGVKIEEKARLGNGKWRNSDRCLTSKQYEDLLEREIAQDNAKAQAK